MEYLLDFPKGSILVHVDNTDIYRAKDILRGHLCLQGTVPSTLLQTGTVQNVKDYCKRLIDYVGKDGGFILSPRSSTDEVKPENLKAMIDFTKEYGLYR
jgi:uroporphyrinogen-III decarboxylase